MGIPKVFVSSTCYDLAEERSQLERFIYSYGFQPILSEYSGVYYDPDEHTHEACVSEVKNADIFILIISGRFGGQHIDGKGESITQAEYNEARKLNIPIFAFVKSDVLQAQLYYKENLRANDETFARKITYPAISKQSDAEKIFSFISQVQKSQVNNALESYISFVDIENHLKKQWAGMFHKFLQRRKELSVVENISKSLEKLSGSTVKLESLVESLHSKGFTQEETKEVLYLSEIKQLAYEFYSSVQVLFSLYIVLESYQSEPIRKHISDEMIQYAAEIEPKEDWLEYLIATKLFVKEENRIRFIQADFGMELENISKARLTKVKKTFQSGVQHTDKELRFSLLKDCYQKLS